MRNVLVIIATLILVALAYNSCVEYPQESGKKNDWFEGVTLWDAIAGNTTPEYDRRVASRKHATETTLRQALCYLINNEDLPEIKWVEFDDNTVYIGFNPYPNDGESILRGAALKGNKAINFGCHVWAIPAGQTDRTSVDRYYNEVTARYGKIR